MDKIASTLIFFAHVKNFWPGPELQKNLLVLESKPFENYAAPQHDSILHQFPNIEYNSSWKKLENSEKRIINEKEYNLSFLQK
jgi:hypothetical protein